MRRIGWRTLPLAGRRARSVLRAPLRLARFPGILAAVLGSTLIIAVAAGASPLFISATGTAAFRERVRATSPFYAGLSLTSTYTRITPHEVADRTDLAVSVTSRLPVGPASVTITGSQASVTAPASKAQAQVRLVMAKGSLSHVQRVAGAGADGFWVARSVADALGLEPGGTVTVQLGDRLAAVRVAGVYRDLGLRPLPAFWTPLSSLVYPSDPALPTPPPFLLGEIEPFAHLEAVLRDRGNIRIDYPLQPALSLSGAETAADAIPAAISDALSPVNVYLGRLQGWVQGPPLFDDAGSGLPSLVQQAEQTVAAATQPVQAISLAGRLVALRPSPRRSGPSRAGRWPCGWFECWDRQPQRTTPLCIRRWYRPGGASPAAWSCSRSRPGWPPGTRPPSGRVGSGMRPPGFGGTLPRWPWPGLRGTRS